MAIMEVGVLDYPVATDKQPIEVLKTVADSGTPEPLTSSAKRVRKLTIYGCKDLSRTPNAGSVFIGSEDSQTQQLVPYDPVVAGGEIVYSAPEGDYINLNTVYVAVGTNGDGVVFTYLE